MMVGMVSAFDIGRSHGLADDAFIQERRDPDPDIGWVGIRNPLGNGTSVDLLSDDPELVRVWRVQAVMQVRRNEIESGWSTDLGVSQDEFLNDLERLIGGNVILRCKLTIYAVGIAYLSLEFAAAAGDLALLPGLLTCWEFAGYLPEISTSLLLMAKAHLSDSVETDAVQFGSLTARAGPTVNRSSDDYRESNLFTSFTTIIECSNAGDELAAVGSAFDLGDPIPFEFHGVLYFSWATCVLVPRGVDVADLELARMRECIRIAHVFQRTCEAFLRIFEDEINSQVRSYVGANVPSRSLGDLNRLRTLAMAIVALTNLDRVTENEEDQEYFAKFAEHAHLTATQSMLNESIGVLYEVQAAEVQEERSKRESVLNLVVVLIALLTLISVTYDAYDFVRDQQTIVSSLGRRLQFLATFLLSLLLLATVLLRLSTLSGSRSRGSRRTRPRRKNR